MNSKAGRPRKPKKIKLTPAQLRALKLAADPKGLYAYSRSVQNPATKLKLADYGFIEFYRTEKGFPHIKATEAGRAYLAGLD